MHPTDKAAHIAVGVYLSTVFTAPFRLIYVPSKLMFIRLYSQGIATDELFGGLWLFRFALLISERRFLPRILSILLIVNGFVYAIVRLTSLLAPDYTSVLNP